MCSSSRWPGRPVHGVSEWPGRAGLEPERMNPRPKVPETNRTNPCVAYAALLTDVYPLFRLDQGGREPGLCAPEGGGPAAM
jgi:hypothetical protein